MKKNNFKTFGIRVLLLGALLGLAFVPIFFIFKTVDSNLWAAFSSGNQSKIVTEVQKYDNKWGVMIVAILQFVQDISIIIPSAPIHIAAGIVLGTWKGFLVCHVADVLYNICIFLFYKKIKKYVDKIVPLENSSKTVKFMKEGTNSTYMVVMACILPAIPNGFIPYAAVNAKVKLKHYFLAVLIGPAIPTFVLTLLGDIILRGNWLLFVFLIIISFVGVYILVKFQNQILILFEKIKNFFTKRLVKFEKIANDFEKQSAVKNEKKQNNTEEQCETDIEFINRK